MKKNLLKRKGFTLIEIIISLCVIGIVSVGLYGAYVLLIKNTKSAEERQSIALVGKRTIEDLENAIEINNRDTNGKEISLSNGQVKIDSVSFLKNGDESTKLGELVLPGDENSCTKMLYLDKKYNFCDETDPNCTYEEKIKIEKAKAKLSNNQKDSGSSSTESKSEENVDIDVNTDKTNEDGSPIEDNIFNIEDRFNISKEKGESSPIIGDTPIIGDKPTLKVSIREDGDDKIQRKIEDGEGNTIVDWEDFSLSTDINKRNNFNLHFNFKNYLKDKDEKLKDLDIIVSNEVDPNPKKSDTHPKKVVIVNINIEKSVDLTVNVEAAPNMQKFNVTNRDENNEINDKIGFLYNMQVSIGLKGGFEKDEPDKPLFTGYAYRNINIK